MYQQKEFSGFTLKELFTAFWEGSDFKPEFYEMFVDSDTGRISFARVKAMTDVWPSMQQLHIALETYNLSIPFVAKHGLECDVTKEDFEKEYEFGKYPHVFEWIYHFAQKGKFLTWKSLVTYLGVENVQRTNYDHSTINEF